MKLWQVALAVMLLGWTWAAQAEVAAGNDKGGESKGIDVVSIKGNVVGGALTLEITPGPAATHALRVYSEPSHTLLAVVEDSQFAGSDEGKVWRREILGSPKRAAQISTQLPAGRARVTIEKRPPTDDRVATWVYGSWPDGTVSDRLLGDGVVGFDGFEFSISVGSESFSRGNITHRCNGGGCNSALRSTFATQPPDLR